MTVITIAVGAILTLAGIIGYVASDSASFTALIPSLVGVLLLIGGIVSRSSKLHRHAIHVSLAVALLGMIGSVMNVVKIGTLFDGTAERPAAIILSTVMFVVLLAYVALGVRSFIAARRARSRDAA